MLSQKTAAERRRRLHGVMSPQPTGFHAGLREMMRWNLIQIEVGRVRRRLSSCGQRRWRAVMTNEAGKGSVLWDLDARGVATVTLNRPQVNNAYNGDMIAGLHE